MAIIPGSYQNRSDVSADSHHFSKMKAHTLLRELGLNGASHHAQAPLCYAVDYTKNKYLYIDPLFGSTLGYDEKFFINAGPLYFTRLCHRNDLKVYNEKIFPEVLSFLKKQSLSDYPSFSFSFNYRIQTKSGDYLSLLQRSNYFAASNDGTPVAAAGFVVDITNYKDDTRIIHTIYKIDRSASILSHAPLFKSVHYPDKHDSVLSKRELEILEAIYRGMSSKELSVKFRVSINTVNNHRKNMLQKTHTNNSSELLWYAQKNGLL